VVTPTSERLLNFVAQVADEPDVKAAVEANHDENRWWPTSIADQRLRMVVAGWSTRVSYRMVDSYASVVTEAARLGFDALAALPDSAVRTLVRPLGLPDARVGYLRSLAEFLCATDSGDLLGSDANEFIVRVAANVSHAGYNVAQCATLYARGYHCGIIPVDSGMVSKLAPCLGLPLPGSAIAHERMRHVLEASVIERAADYRRLAEERRYAVTLPEAAAPTWWVHLVLIYFKRLYCNKPSPRLCPRRPVCAAVLDCGCAGSQ
jgi:hypothetical protein